MRPCRRKPESACGSSWSATRAMWSVIPSCTASSSIPCSPRPFWNSRCSWKTPGRTAWKQTRRWASSTGIWGSSGIRRFPRQSISSRILPSRLMESCPPSESTAAEPESWISAEPSARDWRPAAPSNGCNIRKNGSTESAWCFCATYPAPWCSFRSLPCGSSSLSIRFRRIPAPSCSRRNWWRQMLSSSIIWIPSEASSRIPASMAGARISAPHWKCSAPKSRPSSVQAPR